MLSNTVNTVRRLVLLLLLSLLIGGGCGDPGDGAIQLFYDVNVDDAAAMGLGSLSSVEITTTRVSAMMDRERVLGSTTATTTLPARNQLLVGAHYAAAPGFITQLRIFPSLVRFHFNDGSTADVRVPSAQNTGWKVTVDEAVAPNGYEVTAGHVTGIRLFMNLGELFHSNRPQGWMARPTIRSTLYNIIASGGYEPDVLVVIFDPTTPQATIDNIINGGNFTVDFRYANPPPQLYEVRLPVNMSLRDAHSYFRGFSQVRAVAPSATVFAHLTPVEGTPQPLKVIGAEPGWDKGTGRADAVLAEVSPFKFFTEASDLSPNIWLNQQEMLAVCGTMAQCDPDMDGFVTLKDFKHANFKGIKPPDSNMDGDITCADLIAPGSPYVNKSDDPPGNGNGFKDDLCGWNFSDSSNNVIGSDDHDTSVAGVLGAIGNNGGSVGTCWNCRIMAVVGRAKLPMVKGEAKGATAGVVAAFAYARQNGAHVVNFSAGLYLTPSDKSRCPNRARKVDKKAYSTVLTEMNAVITEGLGDIKPPVPLFTLAGGECDLGEDAGSVDDDYYHWPTEAFFSGGNSKQVSVTVAATANSGTSAGGLASYSDFGGPFEIAAPGTWTGMLDGTGLNVVSASGTSFAAPMVGGVAGLIVSDNLGTFAMPDGAALKKTLLSKHTIVDNVGLKDIPGSRLLTMSNLP